MSRPTFVASALSLTTMPFSPRTTTGVWKGHGPAFGAPASPAGAVAAATTGGGGAGAGTADVTGGGDGAGAPAQPTARAKSSGQAIDRGVIGAEDYSAKRAR